MITELDLFLLGFQRVKQYVHDNYNTDRYRRGSIQVEFTYKGGHLNSGGELESIDMSIDEIVGCEIPTLNELKTLTQVLNPEI